MLCTFYPLRQYNKQQRCLPGGGGEVEESAFSLTFALTLAHTNRFASEALTSDFICTMAVLLS